MLEIDLLNIIVLSLFIIKEFISVSFPELCLFLVQLILHSFLLFFFLDLN